eukprot:3108270-Prymnesium_polylepis.1
MITGCYCYAACSPRLAGGGRRAWPNAPDICGRDAHLAACLVDVLRRSVRVRRGHGRKGARYADQESGVQFRRQLVPPGSAKL